MHSIKAKTSSVLHMIALGTLVSQQCVLKAYTTCHCTVWDINGRSYLKNQFYNGISICGKLTLQVFISLLPIWATFYSAVIEVLYRGATLSFNKGGWNFPVDKLSRRMAELIWGCYRTSSSQWWVLPVFYLFSGCEVPLSRLPSSHILFANIWIFILF